MSNNKYSDISQMGGNSLFLTAPAKDSEIIPKDISATLKQAAEILPPDWGRICASIHPIQHTSQANWYCDAGVGVAFKFGPGLADTILYSKKQGLLQISKILENFTKIDFSLNRISHPTRRIENGHG